jgi:hypothetical protein
VLGDRGLRVVALDRVLDERLDHPRVGVGRVGRSRRRLRRTVGLGRAESHTERAVGRDPAGPPGLVGRVCLVLDHKLLLDTYIQDAEREGDSELAEFFRRAQGESRKAAEPGKDQLRKRLT